MYCLEEADNGKGLFRLAVDTAKFEVQSHAEIFDIAGVPCRIIYAPGIRRQDYTSSDMTVAIANSPKGKLALSELSTELYAPYKPLHETSQTLKFIPYYMWANRGENERSVWVDAK